MAVRMQVAGTTDDPKIDTSYAGAVLDVWERNGYNDSDFYAIVWDEASGTVKQVEYATTRGWTYNNSATIDATEDVKAKAEAWLADVIEKLLTSAHIADAANPTPGKRVRSTTTRGKNKGLVGWVMRREANQYRTYYRGGGYNSPDSIFNQRVAIDPGPPATKWTWMDADKVEVIDPAPADPVEIRQRAVALARYWNWRAAFYPGSYS